MSEINELRKLYLDDLAAKTIYEGVERSRVRYPENWARLPNVVRLGKGVTEPIVPFANPEQKIWIWSDTHFFHNNIIDFSNRPYENVQQMNEHLVANFNDYVGENDISIWVGDIGFKGDGFINELLDQCNGYKILVVGNHDFDHGKIRNLKFDEIHLLYTISTPEVDLVFTHYPLRNIKLPWFNLHGHLHAYPVSTTGHILHHNINCEMQEYRPVELTELIKLARMRLISAEM